MTWSEFVAAVLVDLPVDRDRINVATGNPNYLTQQIQYAVIQIQQLIEFYRGPHETVYGQDDLVSDGLASVGSIPQGNQCRPLDAYYKKVGNQCVSQPLWPYPWGNRYDLVCGNPRIVSCQFLMAIDPWGKQFTVFPSVGCNHQITLSWEGVKTAFADDDETPFDMDVVECVGLFAKAKIARLVDHDLAEHGSYMAEYVRRRGLLYSDSLERRRLALLADSPNQANKCANSLSTCCRDGSAGTCFNPNDPAGGVTDFIAFGDSGDPPTIANTQAVSVLVRSLEPDFVMHMGDTNYPNGDPVTIQDNLLKFYGIYVPSRFYLAFGNHDIESDGGAALDALLTCQAVLNSGKRYYDFIPSRPGFSGVCHIFVLDTNGDPAEQAQWLQPLLAQSTLWNIVVMHKPPYTSDIEHAPGELNWRFDFKAWGANVVLSGHGHNYERLVENGMQYIVCGLGGAEKRGFVSPPTPGSQFRYNTFFGALYVSASETRLQVSFFDTRGEVVDSIAFDRCHADCAGTQGGVTPINPPNPGTWCQLRGSVEPEGVVPAALNCWYRMSRGTDYSFWFKEQGDGDKFGWIEVEVLS